MDNYEERKKAEDLVSAIQHEGVVFSSMGLRKALKERLNVNGKLNNPFDRSHIDMADVFGYLLYVAYAKAITGDCEKDGYTQIRTKAIAEALSLTDRRVREVCNMLQKIGLVDIIKKAGSPNRFHVNDSAFYEITNKVKFHCSENIEVAYTKITPFEEKEQTRWF